MYGRTVQSAYNAFDGIGVEVMAVEMIILKDHAEWLQNRFKGIGGSEISAVIGCNPYLDNITLWELKTGKRETEDISDKPYVQYGTQAEMHLRGLFRLDFPQYKVEYIENNSFRNSDYPWAQASLDGWLTDEDGRKGILEIKTSEILGSQHKEKWKGEHIPQNYYCQCLLYMAVCEADFCILKAQLKTVFDGVPYLQTKHYHINREDVQADIDYLMKKGSEFWQYVEKGIRPPLVLPEI
jgi:putative phage-type endonuclease